MQLTVDQIVEGTRDWSNDKVILLVHQLEQRLQDVDARIEDAWIAEAHRRIEEVETGKAMLVPGEDVSDRVRRIVGG
jgi:H2-forming N5,N10-methylenetetrahydromethanopterin dehydrogenase-like enzyme